MPAYYNEIDPYAAQWLRELIKGGHIAPGDVDERDIRDVQPDDLAGYEQCHFFAGIGGWSRALRLANWPDARPVWTGSCPCQPFSAAGKREGVADDRHLWPHWFRLIRERKPPVVFGEQVAQSVGHQWLDAAAHDLEAHAYATGAVVLPACAVGAPHIRDRLWFVADADSIARHQGRQSDTTQGERGWNADRGGLGADVCDADRAGLALWQSECGDACPQQQAAIGTGWWLVEPGMGRLAHGVPARVGKLRALGNAIVPQIAAEFIMSFAEIASTT